MVSGSYSEVIESPVPVDQMWKTILDGENLIPKVMSHVISSVEVLSGDGGVGTVKKLNFIAGPFKYITEKTEVLDHDNHIFKYSVIEGGLIGVSLKSASFEFKFGAGSGGGSTGTLTLEYETLGDADLSAEEKAKIFGGVIGIVKNVEGYLAANPGAYA